MKAGFAIRQAAVPGAGRNAALAPRTPEAGAEEAAARSAKGRGSRTLTRVAARARF